MNKKNIILWGLIFFFIIVLDIGYSAFGTNLKISGIVTKVRPQIDIRITGFIYSESSNGGLPSMEEYSRHSLFSSLTLPNADSTVEYIITITNYGNEEMGVLSATLPSELANVLQVEFIDYKIGTKLKSGNDGIVNGNNTTIKIKVGYISSAYNSANTTFDNFRLDFAFSQAFDVTYEGFTWSDPEKVLVDSVIRGGTYQQDVGSYNKLRIYQENAEIPNPDSLVSNNILTIQNISGDLKIQNVASVNMKVVTPGNPSDIEVITKYTVNSTTDSTAEAKESSITVIIGSKLNVSVTATSSKLNYTSGSYNNDDVQGDIEETITLNATATVNIKTDQSGASIEYKVNGVQQNPTSQINTTYPQGTIIEIIKISKSGYKTITGDGTSNYKYTVNEHISKTYSLNKIYKINISTNPAGGTIKYKIGNSSTVNTISGQTLTIEDVAGTIITVTEASMTNYKSVTNQKYTIDTKETSHTITLGKYKYTVTLGSTNNTSPTVPFNPTTIFEYNGTSYSCTTTTCSIDVPKNTQVKISTSAPYHNTPASISPTITADDGTTINLSRKGSVTETINTDDITSPDGCTIEKDFALGSPTDSGDLMSSDCNLSADRTLKYHFTRISNLNDAAIVTSINSRARLSRTYMIASGDVTAELSILIGGASCNGTASYKLSNGSTNEVFSANSCSFANNTTIKTLRNSGVILAATFKKKNVSVFGKWWGADLTVTYIPV